MEDRFLVLLLAASACAPRADEPIRRCLEGEIATADGCAPLPDWNPWEYDASRSNVGGKDAAAADAGELDAGEAADAEAPDVPDLSSASTWALRVVNVQMVQSQLVDRQAVTFITLSVVQLDAHAVHSTLCSIVSTEFGGTLTTWSPAAISAIEITSETATFSDLVQSAPFALERTQHLGWKNEDPNAQLPTSASDPSVYDADADGNPGVTLSVSGNFAGDVYVVSRATLSLNGSLAADDRIEGSSATDQEQNVVGATNQILLLGGTTSEAVPELSTFRMVRATQPLDCPTLIETADQLFMDP